MPSSVIKAASERELSSLTAGAKIIKHQVYDADNEARKRLVQAGQLASAIVNDAEAQRDALLAEARTSGYRDGLLQWNEIILAAQQAKEEYLAASENDLLRLAVKIAGKIIGEQLRLQPETIASIVREALKSAPRERRLVIQVNPSDAAVVNQQIRKLLDSAAFQPPEIEVSPLESITPGGCVIVSELGRVDAQLEKQLQCMERVLLKSRR